MPSPIDLQNTNKEGRILLAIQAIEEGHFKSIRAAAAVYRVSRTTLTRRLNGIASQSDYRPKIRNLTESEESVVVKHILDLDSKGFSPSPRDVRGMANKLRGCRNLAPVGPNWATRFVKRTPELKSRFSRKYDYRRAQCEDPEVIRQWFVLVRNTIDKYGIQDSDIYNFDETGFQMGVASTCKVITASDRRDSPKAVQPGDREWATVIQGVSARGEAIPPLIILKGRHHLSSWYDKSLPRDWVVTVSENGWTTNEIGLQWIQHFEKHTNQRKVGARRLLILDGHESHNSVQFTEFCAENNIITLCMPPHASHLLQPLDIACFGPLKKAYGYQVGELIRTHINHVTKIEFLLAYYAAHQASFTPENIQAGFRGAGLVPFNPESVIEKLDVRLRTPTPPLSQNEPWCPKTPQTAAELSSQNSFIQSRIARHHDSSPSSINEALNQLTRGAEMMMHSATLLQQRVTTLQQANNALSQRKSRKRRRIQEGGTLTVAAGVDLSQPSNNGQDREVLSQNGPESASAPRSQRRCGYCRQVGHRIETCIVRKADTIE
jgi:hypothetical protein